MRPATLFLAAVALCGCSATYRLVYSNGFTFAKYDYLVIGKPDGASASTSLYGLDIEFANMMARYNMNVIGEKEFPDLTLEQKKQTLFTRISLVASGDDENLISVSFDDALTGKTVASLTAKADGDMFDTSDRTEAFESVSRAVIQALERDKGIKISEERTKRTQ